jgi:DnaJ-class molecular chaperone
MRAQRQAGIITAEQFRAAMELLEATETCDKCGGKGDLSPVPEPDPSLPCPKCDGTGQMRTLR